MLRNVVPFTPYEVVASLEHTAAARTKKTRFFPPNRPSQRDPRSRLFPISNNQNNTKLKPDLI